MQYSFNELRFTLTRAFVGCGLSYTIAGEFTRAALWIARFGGNLDAFLQNHLSNDILKSGNLYWQNNTLCADAEILPAVPAALACADRLVSYNIALEVQIDDLLAFIGVLANNQPNNDHWIIAWGQKHFTLCENPYGVLPEVGYSTTCTITPSKFLANTQSAPLSDRVWELSQSGIALTDDTWAIIQQGFRRTLVEASAESRARAGAGATDND